MMGNMFLVIGVFIIIMTVPLIIMRIQDRKKTLTDRILEKKFEEELKKEKEEKELQDIPGLKPPKGIFGKIEQQLMEAQLNIQPSVFIMIIVVVSILLYVGAFYMFGQPLVSIAPLPFTLYFLPQMFLSYRQAKQMEKFDSEFVQILRRMSSVLKTGSVLQALEDVKDLPSLTEKSRMLLNEIYHRYKYGDSIEAAFYKVAEKSGSEHFKLCAISIDINKELGADLSQSLNEVAINIQQKMLAEKESKSLVAQSVMIGRILSIVPFGLIGFMVTANKESYAEYLATLNHQIIFLLLISIMFFGIYIVETVGKKQ